MQIIVYLPKDLPQKGKDQKDGQEIKIQDKLEISDKSKKHSKFYKHSAKSSGSNFGKNKQQFLQLR